MSSSSKSSSQTATTTETTDARVAADNGAIVVSGDGQVSVLDGGAIDLARDVTIEALNISEGIADIAGDVVFDALGFVHKAQADTNAIIEQVIEQQREESAQLGAQLIRIGIPAVALVLIAKGFLK